MSAKLNEVVSILLKKHIPVSLKQDSNEDFIWLNDPDMEDVKLLRSVREEIKRKWESVNFRYSGSWFYFVCRRIYRDERLKRLILEQL